MMEIGNKIRENVVLSIIPAVYESMELAIELKWFWLCRLRRGIFQSVRVFKASKMSNVDVLERGYF